LRNGIVCEILFRGGCVEFGSHSANSRVRAMELPRQVRSAMELRNEEAHFSVTSRHSQIVRKRFAIPANRCPAAEEHFPMIAEHSAAVQPSSLPMRNAPRRLRSVPRPSKSLPYGCGTLPGHREILPSRYGAPEKPPFSL
jgi:hypothetical protein